MKTDKPEQTSKRQKQFSAYAKYSGLAIQMCLTIYLGNLLGKYLDGQFSNEGQIFAKGVTLFAVFLSIYLIIRQVTKSDS